ncbi:MULTISPECIES: opacity family porin [Pasteurellaceae]|uniref:Opacity family porin n=1 Tax=Pasteurella atlantica TaxID=2827233 RepID=A0AAW8CL56_9PAST|nr:opacity family porin [Pasteurella atlantica]MBR0573667.1 outer membrane beta-barrel protein [Pasteurella atlantica]MDP8039422.1 opacity family porin [Pasteurella atlantica]MDP8041514.1 opacity family porin [Pasteurella atlantica]MDP8043561.1 opacity family porin [Pasteurella atlantica]MDP8045735.1 opacity family porin [Pasteurella atlantica]
MKKAFLITALSLGLTTSVIAQQGIYVQGDLGYSSIKIKSENHKEKSKGLSPRLSLGYNFGDVRVALDYTHYKNKTISEKLNNNRMDKFTQKFNSFGVSAIYDFSLDLPVTPYIGARISSNHWKFISKESNTRNQNINTHKYSKSKVGLGLLVGTSYNLMPNLDLDVGYHYNYWGKFKIDNSKVKINSHEFSTGLRYTF